MIYFLQEIYFQVNLMLGVPKQKKLLVYFLIYYIFTI